MKKTLIFFLLVTFFNYEKINSEVDFKKSYDYYEKICSQNTNDSLNKQICIDFSEYKDSTNSGVNKMKESLIDKDMNIDKITELIQENNLIIKNKTKKYNENKIKINKYRKKMNTLEKDVLNSLALMQQSSDENEVIDVVMSSTSLEELMSKVDGVNALNSANIQNMADFERVSKELEDTQLIIEKDLNNLIKIKEKQKNLLKEFYRKEVDLYSNSDVKGVGKYNTKLDKLNLGKLNDTSKNWGLPSKHGEVTAITWAYETGQWHPGMDIGIPIGTDVIAPANGVLLAKADTTPIGYGKHIVTVFKRNNDVYTMIFAHLNDFVDVNYFKKGQVIAKSGNTGNSTGPHAHIEIFKHNTSSVKRVVDEFKNKKDYWFGIGYNKKGDCKKVCRLRPKDEFKLRLNQRY